MHLNYLAGLLPFFEPSIEYEDSLPPAHFRLERPASRGLHTFVPLPTSGPPPTMVSHGGIPSHMVINPEPNLRPMPARPPPDSEPMLTTGSPCLPISMSDPGPDPTPTTTTVLEHPRATTRTTIPVPARSKQRVSSIRLTHNQKRNKKVSLFRSHDSHQIQALVILAHYLSHQMYHQVVQTPMTQMAMQHLALLPLIPLLMHPHL